MRSGVGEGGTGVAETCGVSRGRTQQPGRSRGQSHAGGFEGHGRGRGTAGGCSRAGTQSLPRRLGHGRGPQVGAAALVRVGEGAGRGLRTPPPTLCACSL